MVLQQQEGRRNKLTKRCVRLLLADEAGTCDAVLSVTVRRVDA